MKRALLILLLWPALACAAPPALKIPAEVKPAGQYVEMLPDTDAVSVAYVGLSGVEPIPGRWLADRRVFLLDTRGLTGGRYRFVAIGAAKDGEQVRVDFVVVIGDAPPIPPEPGPGPTPPVDPLAAKLAAPYAADLDPQKGTHKANLAILYREASTVMIADGTISTWGDLFDRMRVRAQALGVSGKLSPVQSAIGTELASLLPTDRSKALDLAGRTLAGNTFKRVAVALEALK